MYLVLLLRWEQAERGKEKSKIIFDNLSPSSTANYHSCSNYNHDGNLGQKNGGSFVAAHFPRWQRGKDVIALHKRQLKPRSNDDVQSRQRSKGRNTTSPFPSSYLNRFYKARSLRNREEGGTRRGKGPRFNSPG